MTLKGQLAKIKDELDSRQIRVEFELTAFGVIVKAGDYASELIAKHELRNFGIQILP